MSSSRKKIIICAVLVALLISILEGAPHSLTKTYAASNPKITLQKTNRLIGPNYDTALSYLDMHSTVPTLTTVTNADGTISVFCADNSSYDVLVFEYSPDMSLIRTVTLPKPMLLFGAAAKDDEGNYYLFCGKELRESERDVNNMALVKCDNRGEIINYAEFKGYNEDIFNTVKIPFDFGTCRMEVSGDVVGVYFARLMFMYEDGVDYQASYGYMLNKESFERLDTGPFLPSEMTIPYVSHSFDQFVLPVENGFIIVDQGDVGPRGFSAAKLQRGEEIQSLTLLPFKPYSTYQYTFAQLGGVAETSDGYLLAGAYENCDAAYSTHNGSRNLFLIKMDADMTESGAPIWITHYTNMELENAANPKIVRLDGDRYLVMWESMSSAAYRKTCMAIVDKDGNIIKPITELPVGARLNNQDALRYNALTGAVHWAVSYDKSSITNYTFIPDLDLPAAIEEEPKDSGSGASASKDSGSGASASEDSGSGASASEDFGSGGADSGWATLEGFNSRDSSSEDSAYTVTGRVQSYNPKNPAVIRLLLDGAEQYTIDISAAAGQGMTEREFIFSGVAPGTYTLEITKALHTTYTVKNIVVTDRDVDLTADSRDGARLITLLTGDVTGDDFINTDDLEIIWSDENYNKIAVKASDRLADLNGDGSINVMDVNLLLCQINFNQGAVVID
ncbi:MAG: hypothetical protein LBT44_06695 [Clostridiales bacterium]|jgi:hypothetical protein|nr:hypothetical protein [Clostridiales bacterium]